MNEIDAVDVEIIKLLSRDGRRSSRDIALSLNLHPATVQRRITRLVTSGTLKVLPVVEPVQAGINWICFIGLLVSPLTVNRVITMLQEHPSVHFLSSTAGRFNVVATALFRDSSMLEGLFTEVIPGLTGVKSYDVMICRDVEKGRHIYSLGDSFPANDTLEAKMVQLLYQDGRRSVSSLAHELGLSASVVRRRLKQMIAKGTLRVVAFVDIGKLDNRHITVIGLTVVPSRIQDIKRRLAELPFSRFVASTTGFYDILAVMLFSSYDEMKKFVELGLTEIEGILSSELHLCLTIAKGGMVRL